MATTAETYGFGARAPYATPRASEYDMKERARLSGLFPRVRNEPLSNTLHALVKEFEQNAALSALLERRRALDVRSQYNLQAREAVDAMNTNLVPWARLGRAVEANSAQVAQQIAMPKSGPAPVAPTTQQQGILTAKSQGFVSTAKASADVINPASPALSVASASGLGSFPPPKNALVAAVPKKASAAAVPK